MDPAFLDLDRLGNGRRMLHDGDATLTAAVTSLAAVRDHAQRFEPCSVCDSIGLVDALEILTLTAWYLGDEEAARRAVELVRTWFLDVETRMNPTLQYAQVTPGEARGSHWGLIDVQRSYLLLDLLAVLHNCSDALTDRDLAHLRDWFSGLRAWMLASEQGSQEQRQVGNHGTWYDVHIVAYSLFIDDIDTATSWLETATIPRLLHQVADDGSQPHELGRAAPIEHAVFNLFGLAVLAEMSTAARLNLWSGDTGARLASAVDWLLPYLTAQRTIGRTTKHRGTFTLGAEAAMVLRLAGDRLDRPDYHDALNRFALHRPAARANLVVPPGLLPRAARTHVDRPGAANLAKTRIFRVRRKGTSSTAPGYPKAFIVGCPRSGTVWTRDILARHPLTVVGPESHLFGRLYVPLVAPGTVDERRRHTLEHFDESSARFGADRGPQHWIDRDTLARELRRLDGPADVAGLRVIDTALNSFFAAHGGTPGRMLVEKTPDHIYWADRILRRWPEGRIIEVLRDGRDVVTSLGHMDWAPADRQGQVKKWVDAVECGARMRRSAEAGGRWHVLRFEALKSDPDAAIRELFDFLELPWDDELVTEVVIETEFGRMQQSLHDFRHRRKGIVGGWKTELTPDEIALVENLAGPTLAAAGY